ncbi:MAG: Rrf2 family transcriptional regulator [Acidimicrobiia bacterium]|nr:Rrf2 family transcriptional regulator [Acidimicrobiia bacterium]
MKLELTRKTDLAVKAMRALHAHDGRLTGSDLAQLIETTGPFMSQVVAPLVQAGWVESRPGPTGGYALAVDPRTVSFLELIETIEGPLDNETCILEGGPCGTDEHCSLHTAWSSARGAMRNSFSAIPIVDGE